MSAFGVDVAIIGPGAGDASLIAAGLGSLAFVDDGLDRPPAAILEAAQPPLAR